MFIFLDYFLLAGIILEPEFVRCDKVRFDTTLGTCLAHFVLEFGRAPLANTRQTKHMITVFQDTKALVCLLLNIIKITGLNRREWNNNKDSVIKPFLFPRRLPCKCHRPSLSFFGLQRPPPFPAPGSSYTRLCARFAVSHRTDSSTLGRTYRKHCRE